MRILTLTLVICLAIGNVCAAEDAAIQENPAVIELPPPKMSGGKPLMEALKERSSVRSFSDEELTPQILSDLLWAAFGINRPDTGQRTAPSAYNKQEIDIYVVKKDGIFLYKPKEHMLTPVVSGDFGAKTGLQDFVATAPVNLVFVADFSRMNKGEPESAKLHYATIDTGYISQNVYLYCTQAGLGTVARGWINKEELREVMKLRADQKIILAQTVGYKK